MLNSPPNMFVSLENPPIKHDLNSNRVARINASQEPDANAAMDSSQKLSKRLQNDENSPSKSKDNITDERISVATPQQ